MTHTYDTIKKWLYTQCSNKNAKGFAIDYTSPDIASTLAVNLCAFKGCKVIVTESSRNILKQQKIIAETIEAKSDDAIANAFELAKLAAQTNTLVVQTFNVIDIKLVRPWPARCCLVADLLPFSCLLPREINNLFASVADLELDSTKSLFNIVKYADLNMTVDELEWAYYINFDMPRYRGIITDDVDPVKNNAWGLLTMRQKSIVAALHQRHKATNNRLATPLEFK